MGILTEIEDEVELSREVSDLQIAGSRTNYAEAEAGDDEDEEADDLLVGLGFVEPVEEKWKLARQHFPSKLGGCPAWLDPVNLPNGAQTTCGICENPLEFLLQVYAPIDDVSEAFHRTLFVFICSNVACMEQNQHQQSRSVKIFRSQLPRTNAFYSYSPPVGEDDMPTCDGAPLCTWCGTWKGHKACAACKQAKYCSRSHQVSEFGLLIQ